MPNQILEIIYSIGEDRSKNESFIIIKEVERLFHNLKTTTEKLIDKCKCEENDKKKVLDKLREIKFDIIQRNYTVVQFYEEDSDTTENQDYPNQILKLMRRLMKEMYNSTMYDK